MTYIRLQNVHKKYGQTHAVKGIDLTFPKSEITVLLGHSGCGKTTTLRLVAGLEQPDSGDIWIGDQQVSGRGQWVSATGRKIGMVFQDYALFPHLTVAQNIGFGIPRLSTAERTKRTADLLDLVGLIGIEDRYPHQLSGGQQQRVALARALAPSPEVILLDEPFSNLDASLRQTMREEMRNILHQTEVTTVFVTHDQEEALRLADELVIMDEGHVLQHGAPEHVYSYPSSMQVAQFLAKVNVLSGEAGDGTVETAIGRLVLHQPELTGNVDVVLRPEAIALNTDPTSLITVHDISYFGFHQLVTLKMGDGQTLKARTWSHSKVTIGDKVQAKVNKPVVAFTRK